MFICNSETLDVVGDGEGNGREVDGDVSHEDGERRAAGLDYRDGSPAASRSEEEDRELVLRRRGPTALDLRLLRRRQVAFVDPSLEVETLDAVRRDEARWWTYIN